MLSGLICARLLAICIDHPPYANATAFFADLLARRTDARRLH